MQAKKAAYHHGSLKKSLLAAGDLVLMEKGFKGFTFRECARRAGVSHAAPKHHFGDVTGFLSALAAIGFDRLTKALIAGIRKAKDLDEEFLATTRAYSKFAEDYPEHFRLMFRDDLLATESVELGLCRAQDADGIDERYIAAARGERNFCWRTQGLHKSRGRVRRYCAGMVPYSWFCTLETRTSVSRCQ